MREKKGFWASLFGGGCSCGMTVKEEKAEDKSPAPKKGGCCGMKIVEEPEKGGCCSAESAGEKKSGCCENIFEGPEKSGCCDREVIEEIDKWQSGR